MSQTGVASPALPCPGEVSACQQRGAMSPAALTSDTLFPPKRGEGGRVPSVMPGKDLSPFL